MTLSGIEPVLLRVEDTSMTGAARRCASEMGARLGYTETERGRAALVAAEMATNILQHAGAGELIVQPAIPAGGLDLLALDKGPGMSNPALCMEDGYSTAGTRGIGLGGIIRQSDEFDFYSRPGLGTALLSRVRPAGPGPLKSGVDVGGVLVATPGESACGDAWSVRHANGKTWIMVADGLGHGAGASQASQEAVRAFQAYDAPDPAEYVMLIHQALLKTRGAAVAVAALDPAAAQVSFAGVGNVSGTILAGGVTRSMISLNGTAGHAVRTVRNFDYPWQGDALVVFCSDGITTQWCLSGYPGLLLKHPTIIAGMMYRDFARGRDDVSVVVACRAVASAAQAGG